MTFLDYLKLIQRHWLPGLLLTAVVALSAAGLVQWKNNRPYETTVFLSIGSAEKGSLNNPANIYENVQAADQFSETVQGWFKNPDFEKGIQLIGSSEISARKQEKQNIVVTFSSESDELAQEMSNRLHAELQSEIEKYNASTGSKFILAIYEVDYDQKTLSLLLFLLIGILGGAVVASFALYGYEYLFQKISSPSQAAELLQKQPIERLSSQKTNKLHFLSTYLHKTDKNIQLIGVGAEINKLTDALKHFHNKIEGVNFPEESQKIKSHDRHVVACVLGKSTLEDLRKVQTLLSSDFDLLIVEA